MPMHKDSLLERYSRSWWLAGVIVVLGVGIRMVLPLRGYNYDVGSYRVVADIVAAGGNVYAETTRYNYAPLWFHLLHALDSLPWFSIEPVHALRWKVAGLLTLVDVGIYLFLLRRFSLTIAALFFLNPMTLIITGYHNQFDNLAILIGLLAVAAYEQPRTGYSRWVAVAAIGLSLCVKHVLFLFPLWLAFRETAWTRRIMVVLLPYLIFLLSFVWYLPEGSAGIIKNVFLYRSAQNGPLWSLVAPYPVIDLIPLFLLFAGALSATGYYFRHRPPTEHLLLYLIALVVFSSAVANQYLSIPIPGIAAFWNLPYAVYTLFGTFHLLVDPNALHFEGLRGLTGWNSDLGYQLLIPILAWGLFTTAGGRRVFLPFCRWVNAQGCGEPKAHEAEVPAAASLPLKSDD